MYYFSHELIMRQKKTISFIQCFPVAQWLRNSDAWRSGSKPNNVTLQAGTNNFLSPSTPPLPIPGITPPVSLHCFRQCVPIGYDYISLGHMLEHMDGKTRMPSTSKGSIGKKLVGYQKLSVVNFLSTDCQIPQIEIKVLRKHQQYLLDISKSNKIRNL